MMVWADAISAKNQERNGEHKPEEHPHSLIADQVSNRQLKIPTGRLTFNSWNPMRRTTVA